MVNAYPSSELSHRSLVSLVSSYKDRKNNQRLICIQNTLSPFEYSSPVSKNAPPSSITALLAGVCPGIEVNPVSPSHLIKTLMQCVAQGI
jgi:hypothetical protein